MKVYNGMELIDYIELKVKNKILTIAGQHIACLQCSIKNDTCFDRFEFYDKILPYYSSF